MSTPNTTNIFTEIKNTIKDNFCSLIVFISLIVLSYLLNGKILFAVVNIASLFFLFNILAKTKYTFLISAVLVLFITSDIVYYILYSSSMYVGILSSIMETTPKESREMFGELYIWVIPTLVIVVLLSIKMQREMKRNKLKRSLSIWCFSVITFIIIPAYLWFNITRDKNILTQALLRENPVSWTQLVISSKFPVIYNNIGISIIYFREKQKMKGLLSMKKEMPEGLLLEEQTNSLDRIYIIVGETSLRTHYSLYGYNIPTTPFLDSLKINTKDIYFYNAISPAPITRDAVRLSLSFGTPQNTDAFFYKKNIIDLAKDRGYETLWISNQERVDSYDNYTGLLASSSDLVYFETQHGLYRKDLGLIPKLEEYSTPSKRQLIFLHLQGSHMPYEYRSDSIDDKAIQLHTTENITKYDRTIHYTDRVLKEIYEYSLRNDENSLIYYFSDHGESIGKGHGFMNEGIEQFEIPLIIINNNSGIAVDSIVNKYNQPEIDVINNVNSVYILSEVLGYKVEEGLLNSALNDGQYIYHVDGRPYLFNGLK